MAIDKSPVEIGIDPTTGLTKYRQFLTLEANIEEEYILVYFKEWLQTDTDAIVNLEFKSYKTTDSVAVFVNNGTVVNSESGHFTNWYNQLGSTVIVPSINSVLSSIPNT